MFFLLFVVRAVFDLHVPVGVVMVADEEGVGCREGVRHCFYLFFCTGVMRVWDGKELT